MMPPSITQRADSLLSQMTLDEKLAQLGSYWMYDLQVDGELDQNKITTKLKHGIGQITRVAGASTLDPISAAKAANRLQRFLVEETRLGIPAIIHEECCSGAMVLGGTMYPQMIGLAATFQPELAEMMTSAIRQQLLAIGARQALAPVLDLARDPRWGRIEETFGEDPTLTSHFSVSYIRGLQTNNLLEGVMATGKHFIAHSLSHGGMNCAPVYSGMNDIYNNFLSPFQAAIRDAGLASIMNAYPELDGEVVAASRRILTDLLRGQLGFEGLVVSDYEAIIMLHNFHYAATDKSQAACMALKAGIDVELPSIDCYGEPLKAALERGEINIEIINHSVHRHLKKKIELGLFEKPYTPETGTLELFETDENRSLAHKIACQSMVLLKNDGLLPLSKSIGNLAVIGPNAHNGRNLLGDYSYSATKEKHIRDANENSAFIEIDQASLAHHDIQSITILNGIKGLVSPETEIRYVRGCDNLDKSTFEFEDAINIARKSDTVILVLGDRSGLNPDCTTGETRDSADLRLPGVQEELAKLVISTGVPVVVVLVNGRPYAIPWLAENANAILEAWIPGEEGGAAVADILFGDTNPGGKIPITFPRSVGQIPVYYNRKPSGLRSHWHGDYVSEPVTPLYPFGHGLSYTSFDYSNLSISQDRVTPGEVVEVSLQIKNIGEVFGEEVVQLYVRDIFASSPRPSKELKGYARIGIKPGETKTLIFKLPVDQLAFYDTDLNLVLEPGTMKLMVGSSSGDIRLQAEIEIHGNEKIPIKERVFVCPVEIQ